MAINESRVNVLAEWRPFAIEITLYGHTQETYERLTGVAGSFARVQRAIENLLDRGLPLRLKTVVLKENRHELDAMKEFAQSLGVEFRFDAMINPRLDGSPAPLATGWIPQKSWRWTSRTPDASRRGISSASTSTARHSRRERGSSLSLRWRRQLLFDQSVRGVGSLWPLAERPLRSPPGQLREGWGHFLGKAVERRAKTITKCTSCHLKALCGMCPAYGELENGNPERPVDFLCHVAHLRAAMLEQEIPAHGECEYCPGGRQHDLLLSELRKLDLKAEPMPKKP